MTCHRSTSFFNLSVGCVPDLLNSIKPLVHDADSIFADSDILGIKASPTRFEPGCRREFILRPDEGPA